MENKYLQRQTNEVREYPGKKLPVVFLIDVSTSMNACNGGTPTGKQVFKDGQYWNEVIGGKTIMDNLKERILDFHKAMQEDVKTATTCQTAYVTFGAKTEIIEDFGIVKNKKAPIDEINANEDNTCIVDGIEKSLEILDDQKKLLKEEGVGCFQPWLIILTDGLAHDSEQRIKSIKKELDLRQRNKKLVVYTIALNEDPELYKQIRGYSIYKPIPYDVNNQKLKDFFKYLKVSISVISRSKIEQSVPSYTELDDVDTLI